MVTQAWAWLHWHCGLGMAGQQAGDVIEVCCLWWQIRVVFVIIIPLYGRMMVEEAWPPHLTVLPLPATSNLPLIKIVGHCHKFVCS